MRAFITADIHHGHRERFSGLTEALAEACLARASEGDLLLLGGDNAGADGRGFEECLALFSSFPGPRAFVPGNHDLWSDPESGHGSDALYESELRAIGSRHGFQLLDDGPLRVEHSGGALGVAGSFGGFDFSLADVTVLDEEERDEVAEGWRSGMFRRLCWNDYRFTWSRHNGDWDHAAFAASCAESLRQHVQELEADASVDDVICITHTGAHVEQIIHHPFSARRSMAERLWFRGVSGSAALGDAIRSSPKTRLAVCGHTHHERDFVDPDGRRWINIGCDYPRKRWLIWSLEGDVEFTPWVEA